MKHLLVVPVTAAILGSAFAADPAPHEALVEKYSCAFDKKADEARLMESYLAEKDAVAGILLTDSARNGRMRRLADEFIAPSYFKRNRLLPNSSKLDFFGSGGRQEKLICVKSISDGKSVAVTRLTNLKGEHGQTLIMEYPLLRDGRYFYLNPVADPARSLELLMIGTVPPEVAKFIDRKATMTITPYTLLMEYSPESIKGR